MDKEYDVVLSFAGEDRVYVENVATILKNNGIKVFYDNFEKVNLWGKNLYQYLSDLYSKQSQFCIPFISEFYVKKAWASHELSSAQERAFKEKNEYILPAYFDTSIDVPGILKTTGHIDISKMLPEEFSEFIIEKVKKARQNDRQFIYSDEAFADIDFYLDDNDPLSNIIVKLKSHDWYIQSPAMIELYSIGLVSDNLDILFVLGRNIYQTAVGKEREAYKFLQNIRSSIAKFDFDKAKHVINGMFYEAYFNSKGEFRTDVIKGYDECLTYLFELQNGKKFHECMIFIEDALRPFKNKLNILPSASMITLDIHVIIDIESSIIQSVSYQEKELICDEKIYDEFEPNKALRSLGRRFYVLGMTEILSTLWTIPEKQLNIVIKPEIKDNLIIRLPENKLIKQLYMLKN